MLQQLQNFDVARFKQKYWQQQPQVFRQVLPQLEEPLSPDELAGLALEPGVDSRVIWCDRGQWHLAHGPFDDYARLGDSHWTLLVQAVNEHYPPARQFLHYFNWLPDWRIDDLMVSFAPEKGGVGPHVDQYDVFIIQGQGRRQWQVGKPEGLETILPHPELKQVKGFIPILDLVLEPGDMIYIPAGFPHEGISLEPSLSYSVGFRAPSQAELLSALADKALEHDLLQQRYRDSSQALIEQEQHASWFLPQAAVAAFKSLLQAALEDDELLQQVCANYLSQNPRPPLQYWPEITLSTEDMLKLLADSPYFLTAPGLRWLTTQDPTQNKQLSLYVQGQQFVADQAVEVLLGLFKASEAIAGEQILAQVSISSAAATLVLWLLNEGYLIAEDDVEIFHNEEEA